eukprot:CAMPEP_0119107008 /NCGR_PEP_ID=MMETSP1180-20130426/7896_1 /TAXON_ID=3052 ORGANISM="Chlamydomonas cf sp, Strain CCMP681" /NCGR_SAMPLE_ID=MMETSP1180 /ASSEMBLY_ACC=CAM_ASM_000741 /LENGTH=609 /DNA_ID=CAMNT_0007092431 /DNA_START=328 /DNA_END=2157 /DNA_ORIENTATION=-
MNSDPHTSHGLGVRGSSVVGYANEVVASIDQGTQSTRVYLFDKHQSPIANHQVSLSQIYPEAGWCEHDPHEILRCVKECLVGALREAEAKLGVVTVRAVGITNQRETTMVWHRATGQPLYNAIVWLDTRTAGVCAEMEQRLGSKDYFRPTTGLPISTYFSAFKFKWMYDNVPQVTEAVDTDMAMFGTIDSWLIYNLTGGVDGGVHVTDASNASRTQLMDLATLDWHQPYCQLFSMPQSALPRIVSNAEIYGYMTDPPHQAYLGVPVSGSLGDQMSALLGQRCREGEAKATYGTGCFMLLHTGQKIVPSVHGLLTTVAFKLGADAPPCYALEGAVAVAGLGVSWLRDNLGIIQHADEVESLASQVPDTGGVHFVPAFSGLLAPYWLNDARGVITGLTSFTTRAHICRSLLEAIAWQSREVLDAMKQDADLPSEGLTVLYVDGGAAKNALLMQTQADFLEVPVVRPNFPETSCLGAALAAGLGAGIWEHHQVFAGHSYSATTFKPSLVHEDADVRYERWKDAVRRSFGLATPEVVAADVPFAPVDHGIGTAMLKAEAWQTVDGSAQPENDDTVSPMPTALSTWASLANAPSRLSMGDNTGRRSIDRFGVVG